MLPLAIPQDGFENEQDDFDSSTKLDSWLHRTGILRQLRASLAQRDPDEELQLLLQVDALSAIGADLEIGCLLLNDTGQQGTAEAAASAAAQPAHFAPPLCRPCCCREAAPDGAAAPAPAGPRAQQIQQGLAAPDQGAQALTCNGCSWHHSLVALHVPGLRAVRALAARQ